MSRQMYGPRCVVVSLLVVPPSDWFWWAQVRGWWTTWPAFVFVGLENPRRVGGLLGLLPFPPGSQVIR
jgi:hypothetical protein